MRSPVPATLTDPASAIEHARRAPRITIPHADEVLRRFAVSTGDVEAHAGPAAREACLALGARALTAWNVIAFADEHPSLPTVLHEIAHVIQQGAIRAPRPAAFAPGTLRLAHRLDRAERDARAGTPTPGSARLAVYREELEEEPGESDTEPGTPNKGYPTALLKALFAILDESYRGAEGDRKGIKTGSTRFIKKVSEAEDAKPYVYAEASENPFTNADLQAVAEKVKGEPYPEASRQTKKETFAETRLKELFGVSRPAKLKYKTTFTYGKYQLRVSRAGGAGADKAFRKYVFVGRAIAPGKTTSEPISDDNHFITVTDTAAGTSSEPDYEQRARTYAGIAAKVQTFVKDELKKDEKVKEDRTFEKLIARCKAFLLELETGEPAKPGPVTDKIRQDLRDHIVDNIDYLFDLHRLLERQETDPEKGKGRTFAGVSGFQGSVVAQWLATRYEGLTFDPKKQPIFDMSAFEASDRPDLPGERRGDGVVVPSEQTSNEWWIAESKGYTTSPTESQKKQMQDYLRILVYKGPRLAKGTKQGLPGYLVDPGPGLSKSITFSKVHYYFTFPLTIPDGEKTKPNPLAKEWMDALNANLKKDGKVYYKATPDPDKPQAFEIATEANPIFTFPIKNGDQLDQPFTDLPTKHPVVKKIKSAQLKLQYPREPYLESGKLVMDVDMKGAVTQENVEKTISPVPLEERVDTPTPGKNQIHGKLPAKSKGGTSALDKILSGIETEIALTDKGLAGTILVKEGKAKGFDFKQSTVTATLGFDGKVKLDGLIKFGHQSGKLDGSIKLGYDGQYWSFTGTATVTELFQGLKTFTIKVEYKGADEAAGKSGITVSVPKLLYQRKFGGIDITATITNASYDVASESFGAENVALAADMGAFGAAKGTAAFAKNELTSLSIDYQSPKLVYPKGSKKPLISGTLEGGVTYKDGNFGGSIKGDALLDAPVLNKLSKGQGPLGLKVAVSINEKGEFSGTIGTTTAIDIGKYFSIPSIELTLKPDGEIAGKFGLSVHGIKYLQEATAICTVDKDGFDVESFKVTGGIPQTSTSRFWGTITAEYTRKAKAFTVSIDAYVKIRDNLVAHGTLTYDSQKNAVSGTLEIKRITLLSKDKEYKLFEFGKQIPLINIWGLGLYLDIGAKLKFAFHLDLWVEPSAKLEDFSLDTFKFKAIEATMVLGGGITATLTLEPFVGLGLFVLSPMILRAGGGLMIPISAKASVDPTAKVKARYAPKDDNPDSPYELAANAQLSLVVKFSIDAAIKPYASFVVLDGAYRKDWEGDPLKKFVLLPERELFRYTVDFGKSVKPGDDPKMGPNPSQKPGSGAQVKEGAAGGGKDTFVDRTVDQNPTDKKRDFEETKDDGDSFSFKTFLDKAKDNPTYKKIDSIITDAVEVFTAIGKFFKNVYNFIRKWIGEAIDAVRDALKGIAKHGLFGYLKIFLGKQISKIAPTLWEVLEPLFSALAESEDKLRDTLFAILDAPLPTSFMGFIEWAWTIVKGLIGGAWDTMSAVAKGIGGMLKAGRKVAGRFVDEVIRAGKIGLRWSTYDYFVTEREHPDVWKIHVGGLWLHANPSSGSFVLNEGTVVAMPMYGAFRMVGATPTYDHDYWVAADGDP